MADKEVTKRERVFLPHLDIAEKRDAFVVRADVPGVTPDNIEIGLDGDLLTIHARVVPAEVEGLPLLYREYIVGDYETSLMVSGRIDREKIEALVKDGVLTITLPKAHEVKPRTIEVKAA
jgi:HSP20 family protein